VVAFENKLYVLDTRSPLFGAVLTHLAFVFNLSDNKLEKTYTLQKKLLSNSYINDLRVDAKQ
jgi:hypothetical protein